VGEAAGGKSMAVTPHRVTLAEFLRMPEQKPPLELHGGVVTPKMSPKGPHGTIAFELGHTLANADRRAHRLRLLVETRFSIGEESFVPDLVAYQPERLPTDEYGEVAEDFLVAPDLAVEVMSRGQVLGTMIERCRDMVRLGVPLVLLIVPRGRSIRMFRDGEETDALRGPDRMDFSQLVPGFSLAVDDIFRALHVRDA
jgi:Uma2 family endonuclease